jgi:hypothetical protein
MTYGSHRKASKMETDAIRDYLATSKKAVLQTQVGAEALQAAVHQRWSVKTGADPEAQNLVGQAPTVTTIAQLCAIAVPAVLPPDGRSAGAEETVYQLDATLIGYKHESDGDYHLVVVDDHGNTMVAEIPDPAKLVPGSFFADLIAAARHAFEAQFAIKPTAAPAQALTGPAPALTRATESVTIQGLGFFDFAHGQDGVAPNAIELHPVTGIAFGGSAPGNATTVPTTQ